MKMRLKREHTYLNTPPPPPVRRAEGKLRKFLPVRLALSKKNRRSGCEIKLPPIRITEILRGEFILSAINLRNAAREHEIDHSRSLMSEIEEQWALGAEEVLTNRTRDQSNPWSPSAPTRDMLDELTPFDCLALISSFGKPAAGGDEFNYVSAELHGREFGKLNHLPTTMGKLTGLSTEQFKKIRGNAEPLIKEIRTFFYDTNLSHASREFKRNREYASAWFAKFKLTGEQRFYQMYKMTYERAQRFCNLAWFEFRTLLGVNADRSFGRGLTSLHPYDKKVFDSAMEECFGSLLKRGSGAFNVPGILPLNLAVRSHPGKIFSLYLGRKVFVNCDPADADDKTREFFKRVATPFDPVLNEALVKQYLDSPGSFKFPAPDMEAPRKRASARALLLAQKICDALFTKESVVRYRLRGKFIPNSGKACVQNQMSSGGKRIAIYETLPRSTREVRPCTIVSGGKFRTITLDCAYNQDYAYLNEYMFNIIRKLPTSIAGRDVDQWIPADFEGPYLSGDLESATDNFSGEIAEVVMRHICKLFYKKCPDEICSCKSCWKVHYDQIASFTTQAVMLHLDEEVMGKDGYGAWQFYTQTGGQFMGSTLSFPVLCINTKITGLIACDFPIDLPLKEFRRELKLFNEFGFNGDDIVIKNATEERSIRWQEAVKEIGGVVSRGKTLLNERYFTVNSELFDGTKLVHVIRPSLIVAVGDGVYKAPNRRWIEYLKSPLRSIASDRIFKPDHVLFPRFPVGWGGTGSDEPFSFSNFDWVQYAFLVVSKTRPYQVFGEREAVQPGHEVCGLKHFVYLGGEEPEKPNRVRTGWMKRDRVKEIARKQYGIRKLAFWTDPWLGGKKYEEQLDDALELLCCLTEDRMLKVFNCYKETMEMEKRGYVFAKNVVDVGQEVLMPRWVEYWRLVDLESMVDPEYALDQPSLRELADAATLDEPWGTPSGIDVSSLDERLETYRHVQDDRNLFRLFKEDSREQAGGPERVSSSRTVIQFQDSHAYSLLDNIDSSESPLIDTTNSYLLRYLKTHED